MKTTALILAAVVTAGALVATAPALAAGHAWQVGNDSYHLTFSDLDLHTAPGRAVALVRVEASATRLCQDAGVRSERKACVAHAVQTAFTGHSGAMLKLAMDERAAPTLALAAAN